MSLGLGVDILRGSFQKHFVKGTLVNTYLNSMLYFLLSCWLLRPMMSAATEHTWHCQTWAPGWESKNHRTTLSTLPLQFPPRTRTILVFKSYHLPLQNILLTNANRGRGHSPCPDPLFWRGVSCHEDFPKETLEMFADVAQESALESTLQTGRILAMPRKGIKSLADSPDSGNTNNIMVLFYFFLNIFQHPGLELASGQSGCGPNKKLLS